MVGLMWGPQGIPRDENERSVLLDSMMTKAAEEGIPLEKICINQSLFQCPPSSVSFKDALLLCSGCLISLQGANLRAAYQMSQTVRLTSYETFSTKFICACLRSVGSRLPSWTDSTK